MPCDAPRQLALPQHGALVDEHLGIAPRSKLHAQALRIKEGTHGKGHISTANNLYGIALACFKLGKVERGNALMEQARSLG